MTQAPTAAVTVRQRMHSPSQYLFWAVVLVLWVCWVGLVYWMARYGSWQHGDFDVYYEAAHYFAQGTSPYFGTIGQYYLYPPLLAQLLIPLAQFDLITAWHLWFVLNLILLFGTVALFSRYVSPVTARLIWLTPLLFEPVLDSFYVGQVTILILALLTGAWAARRDEHPFLAGALIAVAAWLKVYPGLLVVYFLWKRDWRVIGGIVVIGIALGAFQLAGTGVQTFTDAFRIIFGLAGGGQGRIYMNVSVLGFTSQLFLGDSHVFPIVSNTTLQLVSRIGLSGILLVALGLLTYQGRQQKPAGEATGFNRVRFDLEFSLALLTAMLLSPTLWASGMPPLLLCFWLVWYRGGWMARALTAFALVILTMHSWLMMGYAGMTVLPGLILSFGFYTLITLWGTNVALLAQERRNTP